MSDLQLNTLRMYGELLARTPADGWGGKLVVGTDASAGLPAAACIAGATCLVLDGDHDAVRATYRDGGFDFLVNTLDEAIRVLKNEIRQRRPLGVALLADVDAAIAEAAERGLLADLAVDAPGMIARDTIQAGTEPSAEFISFLDVRKWSEGVIARGDELPGFAVNDPRSSWVRQLPRYQRTSAREDRVLWMSAVGRK